MTLATPRAWTALLRVVVSTLAAAVLLVGVSVTTASADTQMTATEGVNVRSGPSTKSPIVGGLYRGQTVTAIRSADGWTTVRFNGTTAYIASQYLTAGAKLPAPSEIGAGTVKITTTDLNLRTGPGLSYRVIRVLPEGLAVTLTGKTARGFAEVLAGSSQGWSSLQYLASSANALPVVVGTRTAMADLNVWATSTTTAEIIGEVKKGGTVSITGATQNARAQIIFNNAIRWVTAKYLSNPTDTGPTTPGPSQDHRLPVRDRDTEHPLDQRRQLHQDRRSRTWHPAEYHRRRHQRPGADRLQRRGPLGDREVPVHHATERDTGSFRRRLRGREGTAAERDQGPPRGDAGLPADHDLLRRTA